MPVRQTKIFFLESDSEFKQTHKWAVEAQVLGLVSFALKHLMQMLSNSATAIMFLNKTMIKYLVLSNVIP